MDGEDHKKKRERSPGYPGLALQDAIQRATTIYQHEGKNAAPVNVILGHWGYRPKSGAGLVALAALKHFGLLIDEGSGDSRTARLSDLALRIVQDTRPNSEERVKAIKEAALVPKLHKELWASYSGNLPSDGNLSFTLRNKRGFTEGGAKEFIKELRSTLAFSGLTRSDIIAENDDEEGSENGEQDMRTLVKPPMDTPKPPAGGGGTPRVVNLPLSPVKWAVLQVPAEMGETDWSQLLAVLNAMKPGIVTKEATKQG